MKMKFYLRVRTGIEYNEYYSIDLTAGTFEQEAT
jgi:hypothetical protein